MILLKGIFDDCTYLKTVFQEWLLAYLNINQYIYRGLEWG